MLLFFQVVLETYPDWLDRSIAKIRETNIKLKRIAKEKNESRIATFQPNKNKEKKRNSTDEDDFSYGPRDCDIGTHDITFSNRQASFYLI